MLASLQDILDTVKANNLTYHQKLMTLGNIAERLFDPRDLLGYTDEEWGFLQNQMICDLCEGYAIYRPRYILPDYNVYIQKGCEFLELPPPKDLDEALDGLLILYSHVPSITTYPVYIGRLDVLLEPFITDEEKDYIKIKRFLNHIDKTVPDSFCHANIGPYDTKAGRLILRAVIELEAPTPNMTIRYDKSKTSREFAELAAKACLLVSKPSFANDAYYISDLGEEYGVASCYNALPECGGAYTLTRLRLGTIARTCKSADEMLNELLPRVAKCALSTMDKRHKFVVEESNFFNSSFLEKEGFIKRTNFTGMFAIVGLADATNHLLQCEGLSETFGKSVRGDEIATAIMDKLKEITDAHEGVYAERTGNRYLLHAQVGASNHEEDKRNAPAHRIRFKDNDFAAIADFDMAQAAVQAAKAKGKAVRVGNLFSADLFYTPDVEMFDVMEKYGILGVEMEAAGIYGVAAEYGVKALTICTVSDHIRTHEQTTAEERQLTFNDMIEIALDSVLIGDAL